MTNAKKSNLNELKRITHKGLIHTNQMCHKKMSTICKVPTVERVPAPLIRCRNPYKTESLVNSSPLNSIIAGLSGNGVWARDKRW